MSRIGNVVFGLFLIPWALFSVFLTIVCVVGAADAPGFWALGVLFVVMAYVLGRAILSLFGFTRKGPPLRHRRRVPLIDPLPPELKRLSRVAIRDAVELRRVLIVGKVRLADKRLTAPLSDRPCCFYDARVFDESGMPIARETRGCDFFVDDGTGRALVRARAAQPIVKLDAAYASHGTRATSRQVALLERHDRWPHGELEYREGTLTPGERVAVIGVAVREPDPEGGASYREMPTRLVFDGEIVCVTDLI